MATPAPSGQLVPLFGCGGVPKGFCRRPEGGLDQSLSQKYKVIVTPTVLGDFILGRCPSDKPELYGDKGRDVPGGCYSPHRSLPPKGPARSVVCSRVLEPSQIIGPVV